jgi:hypothetical protein
VGQELRLNLLFTISAVAANVSPRGDICAVLRRLMTGQCHYYWDSVG